MSARNVQTQPNKGIDQSTTARVNLFQVVDKTAVLLSVMGLNLGADQYLQIWDASSKTDTGAILKQTFLVAGGKNYGLDTPMTFQRGVLLRFATQAENTRAALAADTNLATANQRLTTRHI